MKPCILVAWLFCFSCFSQNVNYPFHLAPFKEGYVLVKKDSLTFYNKELKTHTLAHGVEDFREFNILYNDYNDKTYLIHQGGGELHEITKTGTNRIDNSFQHKAFYKALRYFKQDTLFSYGGYGYFHAKNFIQYFDPTTKEWEYYKVNTEVDQFPKARYQPVSYKTNNELFIALGTNPLLNINNGITHKNHEYFAEVWKFDFNSKSYTEVAAQINPRIDGLVYTNYHFINCNYKNGRLFKGEENMMYMDFINNSLKIYEIPESTRSKIKKIVYHPKRDEFFGLFGHHTGENQDFKVIDKSILFDNPFVEEPLFFSKQDQTLSIPYIILLIVLLLAGLSTMFVFKKKTQKKTPKHLLNTYHKALSNHKKLVFEHLINNTKNFTPYADLIYLLDSDSSYDTNKKRLTAILGEIDTDLKGLFETESDCINIRKSPSDKRIREVKLNLEAL
jgi:hypothetical protein